MKKKILSFMLAVCMVIGFIPYTASAAETRTVTVIAGAGGKVSADGTSWSDNVSVSVADGETVGSKVQYRAKEGYAPGSITSLVNIVAVAAGEMHTVILDDQGRVYTCGYNYHGQRGVGVSTNPYPTGTDKMWQFLRVTNGIDESIKITAIAAGYKHTVLLDEDGNVYTAGYNEFGQLGRSISSATKVKNYGDISFGKVTVGDGSVKIKAIAAGQNHTILIDESGKVWTAGANGTFSQTYQLGRSLENGAKYDATFRQVTGDVNDVVIVAAAAGNTHTLLLDSDGNVWAAGSNSSGEAGFNYRNDSSKKEFTKCTIPGSPKIKAIAAGSDHSVLLDESGNVYTAGSNLGQKQGNTGIGTCGQLGKDEYIYGTTSFSKVTGAIDGKKIVSVSAGEKYTIAVDENGAVYATGLNSTGQIGMPTETWNQPGFIQISEGIGNATIVSAEAGKNHTILLDRAGKIWSAGSNQSTHYALGQNITSQNCTTFALAVDSPGLQGKIDLNTFRVTGDCTVNISFKEKTRINVYYTLAGGSWLSGFAPADYYYKEDNTFEVPAIDKVIKNGYTPTEWSKTTYGNSETYTMKWEPKSEFTVHYDTKGGTAISDKTNVKWTDKVLDGVSDPIKTGYEFKGWKCGSEVVKADTTYADLAVNDTVTAVTLTAQWVDVANPTGKIEIAGKSWNSLSDNINFEFFKEAQTVTVTAADNSGEEVKVEYLLSNKKLTEKELREKTFTKYAQFMIKPDNEYVIYVKLTDTSNNVAYINTDGIVLDSTAPVISGIEAGKTYCKAQTVTVTENYIDTVTVNGNAVTLDDNNSFLLDPTDSVQKIVATDKAGNETAVSVTVNDGHTYDWQSANGQYWQKCKFCNHETAPKDIPKITISGADTVCRTQDYVFRFTLPEGVTDDAECGYGFALMGGDVSLTVENGVYSATVKAEWYAENENIFNVSVYAKTDDGFVFSVEKTVTVQNEHSGGTATCKDKAVCEVCGESYGELSADNHSDLKHIDAKAATETDEGNTEYWYCSGCGKYYKDAEATQEIAKADTVTAKLPEKKSTSPKTGDTGNLAMWIALLFVSGGAAAVAVKKKKHSL